MNEPASLAARTPLTAYQRRLFLLLGVATFFEGYDFFALTQVLTSIRREFGLDYAAAGWLVGTINAGTGLFTAGNTTGVYDNSVRATQGSIFGTATVTVTAPVVVPPALPASGFRLQAFGLL